MATGRPICARRLSVLARAHGSTVSKPIHVIGGGLAGSEAAWQIASRGVPVVLHEMRPVQMTAAHKTDGLAELVCSNSFRSDAAETNAVGLLHEEMRRLGSLVMRAADANQVPAGGALAVDRVEFSATITAALENHPLVTIDRGEIAGLPPQDWDSVIVATGPLTSPALADAIRGLSGEDSLAFFDAIAPIVHRESIDMSVAWFQSRYDKAGPGGSGNDYINCPLDRAQYEAFVDALLAADKTSFHEWEATTPYFDGCLPIEIMAERGRETLRHGPLKPFGLTNEHQSDRESLCGRAIAAGQPARHPVQHGRLPDQAQARRAGAHLPHHPRSGECRIRAPWRAASQYIPQFAEASRRHAAAARDAAVAFRRARSPAARAMWNPPPSACWPAASPPPSGWASALSMPPVTTAHGALLNHITGGHVPSIDQGPSSFQPMNVNFGLFPPLTAAAPKGPDGKRLRGTEKTMAKKRMITARALNDLDQWLDASARTRRPSDHAFAQLPCARSRRDGAAGLHSRRRSPGASGRTSCSSATCSRPSSAAFSAAMAARSKACCGGSISCRGGPSGSRGIFSIARRARLRLPASSTSRPR